MEVTIRVSDLGAHELEYRAGLSGFGTVDGVPHWRCTCGEWRVDPNLRTGSPQKKHRAHVKDVGSCA